MLSEVTLDPDDDGRFAVLLYEKDGGPLLLRFGSGQAIGLREEPLLNGVGNMAPDFEGVCTVYEAGSIDESVPGT